jgi:long-chain acyl-CoA synthetase
MTPNTHPSFHANLTPDKPALIMAGSGETLTFAQLESASNRGAQLLRRLGLKPADHIAVMMENHPLFFEVYWAAQRAGLYFTPVSTHLTAEEAAYIVNDCGARLVVASPAVAQAASRLPQLAPRVEHFLAIGDVPGYGAWQREVAAMPDERIPDEVGGHNMMYSSGTTGRPKGIKVPFAGNPITAVIPILKTFTDAFGYGADTVYLSPAPMYHSSPLGFAPLIQRMGGTVVMMEKFDAEQFLACVERYKVTHTQVVPTMFVRMLKLPEEVRSRYDLRSMRCALHAAAPCPVPVKEAMLEWWGPVIYEQYSGSEGVGNTVIGPHEWLQHKGSVGRPLMGAIKIVAEDGKEQPVRQPGMVYFATNRQFEYHNDPVKTREAINAQGWATLGDVGYLDEEGFLYLTDRKAYMIVSGGVNIYPQEAENVLSGHPQVADVAVFGVPNPEFGEEVKAVVQPVDIAQAGPALERELIAYCRQHLSSIKCPKSVDFEAALPRQDNGKLYKRVLRDRYWAGRESRIV